MRELLMSAFTAALRLYTRHVPFHRGRGLFSRPILFLEKRGWPPPLIPIGEGLVMEYEPSLVGWTVFERGVWEPKQTAVFLSLIEPGDVVLNVGANTGYYTLLAAAKAGPAGHVYAFEIQAAMIEILKRNIARNGLEQRVTVVEEGCYSESGMASIVDRGDPGSARIRFGGSDAHIPLTTLDAYAASEGLRRADVLLIDAEGADFEILKGASELLSKFHPVVMAEVHSLDAFGGSPQELEAYMTRLGYAGSALSGEYSQDMLFKPVAKEE